MDQQALDQLGILGLDRLERRIERVGVTEHNTKKKKEKTVRKKI